MRRLLIAMLLMVACRDRDGQAGNPADSGGRTLPARAPQADSGVEAHFFDKMFEHQEALGALLRDANAHDLSQHTRRRVEQAAQQHRQDQANLAATGARHTRPRPPDRALSRMTDRLDQLRGDEYETALVNLLLANYRAQLSHIDSFLPALDADVKGVAKQIRTQRHHIIDEWSGR